MYFSRLLLFDDRHERCNISAEVRGPAQHTFPRDIFTLFFFFCRVTHIFTIAQRWTQRKSPCVPGWRTICALVGYFTTSEQSPNYGKADAGGFKPFFLEIVICQLL